MPGAAATLAVALAAMPLFARPTTDRPAISEADTKAEAQIQAEYIVRSAMDEQRRLMQVADRLYAANRDLCPEKAPRLGVAMITTASFGKLAPAAHALMGASDAPQIWFMNEGGAAAKAGLKIGDRLTSVDGVAVKPTEAGLTAAYAQIAKHQRKPETPVELVIDRDGQTLPVSVAFQMECAYGVAYQDSDEINAYADGQNIYITKAIMRFARTDDELALIVAHELAHDIEGHMKAQKRNAAVGAVGGALLDIAIYAATGANTNGAGIKAGGKMGGEAYSPEFEEEADYVGLYMMTRAGYDGSHVGDMWRRMSVEFPNEAFIRTSHPANPSRYLAIAATNKEIEAKRQAGQPLLPEKAPAPAK